jgi:hypothetical protein
MNCPVVDETLRTLFQLIHLMKRNEAERPKTRPFSRLLHETELVKQPRKGVYLFHSSFLGDPIETRNRPERRG